MSVRLATGWLAVSLLSAACATSGGGSGAAARAAPAAGTASRADAAPAAGAAATPSAAVAASAPGAGSAGSAGAAASAGTAAGTTAAVHTGGSADPGLPARTPAEQRAAIDSRLDASLASFDNRLRSEQQQTAASRDAQAAAGTAVDPLAASDGQRRGERDEIHRDRSGDLQSVGVQQDQDAPAGQQGAGTNGVTAKPIPSGADDDIVARRLRRAAENETDPELKEKLWKEYRDYKENTKGST
jgi:hypothetical protein